VVVEVEHVMLEALPIAVHQEVLVVEVLTEVMLVQIKEQVMLVVLLFLKDSQVEKEQVQAHPLQQELVVVVEQQLLEELVVLLQVDQVELGHQTQLQEQLQHTLVVVEELVKMVIQDLEDLVVVELVVQDHQILLE
jgi:hypothetical protein